MMATICDELGLDLAEVMRAKERWMEAWTIEEEEMIVNWQETGGVCDRLPVCNYMGRGVRTT